MFVFVLISLLAMSKNSSVKGVLSEGPLFHCFVYRALCPVYKVEITLL